MAIRHPLPALFRHSSHCPVDDITVGNSLASIPSFTDLPSGADRLRITLTAPVGFSLHIIPFTLAPSGSSALEKGPAAKPFASHPAMASVICAG